MNRSSSAVAPGDPRPVPAVTGSVLVFVCGMFFLSRLIYLGVAEVSRTMIVPGANSAPAHSWIERLDTWDATWYVDIAQKGYYYNPLGSSSVGFYPLYPLLLRALHACGLDTLLAGYLVSHVALFAAALLCWRLAALETRSANTANTAVKFLLLGPGAVWFGLVYSESLFLLTFVGCLLAARRGRWLEAGIWGYGAALTRTPGLFLTGFLCLEAVQQWRSARRSTPDPGVSQAPSHPTPPDTRLLARLAFGVCGPVLGQLTFLAFLQVAFGNWHAQQLTVQAGWFSAGFRSPLRALVENWTYSEPIFAWLSDPMLAVALVAGVASLWTLRRWGYSVLILALALLYLVSTNGDSLTRYLSTLAPVYLVLAQAAERSRLLETVAFGFSLAAFVLLTVFFANGYHIT